MNVLAWLVVRLRFLILPAWIVAAVVAIVWPPIAGLGLDPTWTIAIASLPVTVVCYRPAKGLWFGLLYLFGFMESPAPAAERPTERST